MKNTIKITAIATITAILLIIACGCAMAHAEDNSETFELLGTVTAWRKVGEVVEYDILLEDGTILAFYADQGDFRIGDLVYITVWDGTELEVLDVDWVATFEWDEMIRWIERTER